MTTTAARPVTHDPSQERSRRAIAVSVGSDAVGAVKAAAEGAATRFPAVAAMGRSAFDDASRRIDASSDEMVRLGTVLSFGLAAGLLIGGASRILVGAALVPVGMLGLTLLERTTTVAPAGTSATQGLRRPAG